MLWPTPAGPSGLADIPWACDCTAFANLAIELFSRSVMTGTELLTVSQAAEALSASTQTIRNWIRSGRLRGVRIGNRFLIPHGEIERMRGDFPTATGEGPWELDENE